MDSRVSALKPVLFPDRHPSILYIKKNNVSERRKLFERESQITEENENYKKFSIQKNHKNGFKTNSLYEAGEVDRDAKVSERVNSLQKMMKLTSLDEHPLHIADETFGNSNMKARGSFTKSKSEISISKELEKHDLKKSKVKNSGIERYSCTTPRLLGYKNKTKSSYKIENDPTPFNKQSSSHTILSQTSQSTRNYPPKPPRMISYNPPSSTNVPSSSISPSIYEYLANTHSQVVPPPQRATSNSPVSDINSNKNSNSSLISLPNYTPLVLHSTSYSHPLYQPTHTTNDQPTLSTNHQTHQTPTNEVDNKIYNENKHKFSFDYNNNNNINNSNNKDNYNETTLQKRNNFMNENLNNNNNTNNNNNNNTNNNNSNKSNSMGYSPSWRSNSDTSTYASIRSTFEKSLLNNNNNHDTIYVNNKNNNNDKDYHLYHVLEYNQESKNKLNRYIRNQNISRDRREKNVVKNNYENSNIYNKNNDHKSELCQTECAVPAKIDYSNTTHADTYTSEQRSLLKSKMNEAYSILRRPPSKEVKPGGSVEDFCEGGAEFHLRRLQYVDNVSRSTMRQLESVSKQSEVKIKGKGNLIDYSLIVSLNYALESKIKRPNDAEVTTTSHYKAEILFMWPEKLTEAEQQVHHFCFPDSSNLRSYLPLNEEIFSFYITSDTGDRKFCWCLRYSIPVMGELALRHEAVCVVSSVGEAAMFVQVLQTIRQARGVGSSLSHEIIKSACSLKLPRINKEVYLKAVASDGFKYTTVLKRASDSEFSTSKYGCLVQQLPMKLLVQVVASMMLERKLVLIANQLSTLSACIMAICNLLYPFSWPHTLISALPPSLAEVLDAPSPYIIGILSATKDCLNDFHLDDVLVINLDGGFFVRWVGDEESILPKKIQNALLRALSEVKQDGELGRVGLTDATVSESFMRMFVETCGHYRASIDFTASTPDFKRENFVRTVNSGSVRLFLDWFSRTSMFQIFVTDRAKKNKLYDVFEERIEEYQQEMQTPNSANNKAVITKDRVVKFFKSKIVRSYKKAYI